MTERTIIKVLCAIILALGAALIVRIAPPSEPAPVRTETVQVAKVTAPAELAPNAAALRRENDGHFWSRANVDGTSIKFLVDTGASVVALTYRDAQRLRLKPEELDFKWSVRTANGETFAASVLLDSIQIGEVEVENVEAMIMKQGRLENSLLGMSFLGALYSYEFKGNTLIIRQ